MSLALGLYIISIAVCALVATTARLANTQRELEEDIDGRGPRAGRSVSDSPPPMCSR